MTTIVTRAGKGSALTHTEMDANFTNLNTDKLEASALAPYETSAHAASTYETITNVTSGLAGKANTSHTQTASTITDFNTAADARVAAAVGVSVQGYDVNTVKKNVANTFSATQTPATGTASVSTTSTFSYDPSTHGQVCTVTLTNATTVTLAVSAGKAVAGTHYTLILKAGDTSTRTFAKGATILAPAATLPITSGATTTNSWDVLHLVGVDTNTMAVVGSAADVR
jgi:hypothetical protein